MDAFLHGMIQHGLEFGVLHNKLLLLHGGILVYSFCRYLFEIPRPLSLAP